MTNKQLGTLLITSLESGCYDPSTFSVTKKKKLITGLRRLFIVTRNRKFTISRNSMYKMKKNYMESQKKKKKGKKINKHKKINSKNKY